MFANVVLAQLLICLVTAIPLPESAKELHPDTGRNIFEMVERQGYPIERHENVATEDGYLLEIHRIPHRRDETDPDPNRPVVLLMHGLLCSSADWVNMGPEKSLAYLLVDAGYDVWMGNARGNTWSRKHVSLNPDKDHDFWKFSWNEIGLYDLPAIIDYILIKTEQKSLFYVAHSQGTTAFWVMASERPEYNEKIRHMSALAPVAYMSHMTSPFGRLLATFENQVDWIAKFIGMYEFMPHSELLTLIGQMACNDEAQFAGVCKNILFLIAGFDSQQLNETLVPVITSNTPAGSSTRQFLHYAQEINSEKFRKYDFGLFQNLLEYGHASPPNYDLSKISAPVALYYGANDWLAAVEDVEQLYHELPHVAYKYLIPFDKFNHLDFLWATDARELLYDRVNQVMGRYL